MRKLIVTLLLLFCVSFSFAQKMTIRTCEIQYGDVLDYNLDDVVMDGDPIPYVAKFQINDKHFVELTNDGNHKYDYASDSHVAIKTSADFRIRIKDEDLDDYDVYYSYKNQTITFIYSDGGEALRLTRFTIDHIKVK